MELISVIVPVYKVEPYLDRCVQSIVDQTYTNLEIILVDDGSPDRCPQMCDAWAEKDSRIKVIHKENGGLSDARNAGMRIAAGTYIAFVDSDDYISKNMYELLHERVLTDKSDISACGVVMVFEDGEASKLLTKEGSYLLDTKAALSAVIEESLLKQPVWNKLYKAELVREIRFPKGKHHEDVFWSYQAIAEAKRVSIMDTPCYYYVQRHGSIMNESYSIKRLDALEAKCMRIDFLISRFPALVSQARVDLFFSCLYMGQMSLIYLEGEEQEEAFKRLNQALQKYSLTDEDKKSMIWKQRIWVLLVDVSFATTCMVRNYLTIGF